MSKTILVQIVLLAEEIIKFFLTEAYEMGCGPDTLSESQLSICFLKSKFQSYVTCFKVLGG